MEKLIKKLGENMANSSSDKRSPRVIAYQPKPPAKLQAKKD